MWMLSANETGFTNVRLVTTWLENPNIQVSEKQFLPIAHAYTSTLSWATKRTGYRHGVTVESLIGVFLYRVSPTRPDIPEYHWIIVGPRWPYPEVDENRIDQNEIRNRTYSGLPHAYIWTGYPDFSDPDRAPNPACALDSYVGIICEWVKAVRNNSDLSMVYPVDVPSGKTALEYANDIDPLLKQIDTEILPNYAQDLKAGRSLGG
jgi:hypothetical protein